MNEKEFGELIKSKRKELGITQTELAEKLGISSYKTISKWENGIYMPDISYLLDISRILNISLYELLGGKEKEKIKESDVENVLKATIKESNNKTKKFNLLKKVNLVLIILLSIILITLLCLFSIKLYKDNEYLFSIRPENVKIENIKNAYSDLTRDNFYTTYYKDEKSSGIEETICKKLPLYKTKSNYLITPNNNHIIYRFGVKELNEGQSENDINKLFNDDNYTKKSMFINSVILFKQIGKLESVDFYYKDSEYYITRNTILKYFKEDNDYIYIENYQLEVLDKLDNSKFLNEFLNV